MRLDAELKVLLEAKENFLLDLNLDVYRYTDANEELEKRLKGAYLQMVESMKLIQLLSVELEDLKQNKDVAASLVDLVDPVAEGSGIRGLCCNFCKRLPRSSRRT